MIDRETRLLNAEDAVQRAVSEGLSRLKVAEPGWTNERLAAELGVDEKTVRRWEDRKHTIRRTKAAALDSRWPIYFPSLMDLLGEVERSRRVDRTPSAIRLGSSIAETYREAVEALEADPRDPDLRTVRHCAFHGDLGHERHSEDDVPEELSPLLQRFAEAMAARIAAGWQVRTIYTVGSETRLDDSISRSSVPGAQSFEVRAFIAGSVPLIAPLIIADTAFIATDHQLWSRAEAALRFDGNPSILLWLHRYFDMLWDTAPL